MKKIMMFFADGFEEIEAVTPIDVFRRLGINVTLVGLNESGFATGAHQIVIKMDCTLEQIEIDDVKNYDAVMLPGGLPGSEILRDNDKIIEIFKEAAVKEKLTCAICAAPIALQRAGLLDGKKFTCYPSFEEKCNGNYTNELATQDGMVITGKGVGGAFAYAKQVAIALGYEQEIKELYDAMLVEL
jgi:4-methyl-5(b-hydroxyethyl)-thiazole monophosphate biosynthesis